MSLSFNNELKTPVMMKENYEISEDLIQKSSEIILSFNTSLKIKKLSNYIYIEDLKIKISKMTIGDLVLKLQEMGVTVILYTYENIDTSLLPALLINDFCNYFSNVIKPTTNPFDLTPFTYIHFNTVKFQSFPILKDILVTSNSKIIPSEIINNKIYYKNSENINIFYTTYLTQFDVTITENTFHTTLSSDIYKYNFLGGTFDN